MDYFRTQEKRRLLSNEICQFFENKLDTVVVEGFKSMLHKGDSIENNDRISGFFEINDRREWLMNLDSKKAMKIETAEVAGKPQLHSLASRSWALAS